MERYCFFPFFSFSCPPFFPPFLPFYIWLHMYQVNVIPLPSYHNSEKPKNMIKKIKCCQNIIETNIQDRKDV